MNLIINHYYQGYYISDEEKNVLIKGYRAVIEKLDSMIKSIKIARK